VGAGLPPFTDDPETAEPAEAADPESKVVALVSVDVKKTTPTRTKSQTKPSTTWPARTPARAQLLGLGARLVPGRATSL
jgi:hypothetical protein